MLALERWEILQHYLEELQDMDVTQIPEQIAWLLGVSHDMALEIVRLNRESQLLKGKIKSLKKLLSRDLFNYLFSLKYPASDYRISIDHTPIYLIQKGLVLKQSPKVIVSCGTRQYWLDELTWDWYSLAVHRTNQVIIWLMSWELDDQYLTLHSIIDYLLRDMDGTWHLSHQSKGPSIQIPLKDGTSLITPIGLVSIDQCS